MKELVGDLWTAAVDVRIIPTNGTLTPQGNAVMGAGVAQQAQQRFPMLPADLGRKLKKYGNHVHYFDAYQIITFPTKHDWRRPSDLSLVADSVDELKTYLQTTLRYAMPRVGTGLGGLDWTSQVRPLLSTLPDNVTVITWQPNR